MSSKSDDQLRPRAPHLGPQRRRPQVLDTALTIAVAEGPAAVTIAAVAERMAVTRPVVYACFADRAQLLEALCRREEQYFVSALIPTLPPRALGDDHSALAANLRTLLRLTADRPQSWHFLTGLPEPDLIARADGAGLIRQRCTTLLRASLDDWGATGIERKVPVLVNQWIAAGEAAVRTLLAGGGDWTPEELGGFVGASVYRMLREA